MKESKEDIGKIAQFVPGRDLGDHFFVGYEDEIKIGMNLLRQAADGGVWRVLIFGFPGCGKSEYPFVLASKAKALGINASLLYVKCHRLASFYDDANKMKAYLKGLTDKMENFQPIILAFDEFDAISPKRDNHNSSLTELSLWAMSFLSNGNDVDSDKKIVFFGITNFPNQMDVAVRDRLQYPIHFGNAGIDVIGQMLEHNEIPNSGEVAAMMLEINSRLGQTITGRGIALACKALKRLEKKELKEICSGWSSEDIARVISVHARLPVGLHRLGMLY